jgi:hypothetical protein
VAFKGSPAEDANVLGFVADGNAKRNVATRTVIVVKRISGLVAVISDDVRKEAQRSVVCHFTKCAFVRSSTVWLRVHDLP